MIDELRAALEALGPATALENMRRMRRARPDIRGYVTTTVTWALAKVGFLDELEAEGSVDLDEFCSKRSLDPELLQSACRYLARVGHLQQEAGRVRFSESGRARWDAVSGVVRIFSAYEPFFVNLPGLLAGEVSRDSLRRDDDAVALGFRQTGASFTFAAMGNIIEREGTSSLVELGCGNIDLSLYLCRRFPALRCLGIDWDDRYLGAAKATIESEGLTDRVAVLKHDVFALDPSVHDFSPYRLVTAIDLFHGYYYEGRERLLDLLRAIRDTFPTQRFLFSDMCLADEGRMRSIAYPMVEHELFHSLTGQRTFAQGELEGFLSEAGFTLLKQWPLRNLAARLFLLLE
ncbi:MAG: class I SAM-dependent methyltransferase [Myxococcota bacterium]|nr:class I SAM-dependent methyltransferase [Myxococcota bacterium]